LTVLGVPLTRTTGDGAHGDSAVKVKTFVDARISITPDATNGITEPHTFTVTLLKNLGDGNGFVAAPGEHVSVTLTDGGGAAHTTPTGSCTTAGANTDSTGKCQITFTSTSAGTVTGQATSTLTVLGVPLTRTTGDGAHGDSSNAVKTFVQGTLSWIKHDGQGNLLGGATFQVCATGGTAAGLSPTCVTVVDNTTADTGGTYSGVDTDPHAGQFTLSKYQSLGSTALGGLAMGTYTIQETAAPPGFQLDPHPPVAVTLTLNSPNGVSPYVFVNTTNFQGCTPGFWKNHTAAWDSSSDSTVSHLLPLLTSPFGYDPSKLGGPPSSKSFNNQPFFGYGSTNPPYPSPGIFGLPSGPFQGISSSLTLIGALNLGGGGFQALARHGTAALLSSGSVQYQFTPSQVLNGVRNAFISGNSNQTSTVFPKGVLTELENANNQSEQACPTG
jgi:hypothetical protein